MGHIAQLQTVPSEHPVVREWLDESSGRDVGEEIQQLFFRLAEMRRGMNPEPFFAQDDRNYQDYQRRIIEMIQQFPWMVGGYTDLNKGYQYIVCALEMLSENQRERELASAAVIGFHQIGGTATASQGRPIQWNNPQEVREIEKFLLRIEKSATGSRADHSTYRRLLSELDQKLEQNPADTEASETREALNYGMACLRELLMVYKAGRQSGFGVIAVRD